MLKKRFMTKLTLVVPDLNKKMRMVVDTSNYIIEEVLLMEFVDKRQRLVAYFSKLLNEKEQNYEIHNKEMLVVIRELKLWR